MSDIKMIAMGCKPDPYTFTIKQIVYVGQHTIVLANYPGSLTFGGDKLMLLRDHHFVLGATLDPHFLDDDYAVVARFIPTQDGWRMARICAQQL